MTTSDQGHMSRESAPVKETAVLVPEHVCQRRSTREGAKDQHCQNWAVINNAADRHEVRWMLLRLPNCRRHKWRLLVMAAYVFLTVCRLREETRCSGSRGENDHAPVMGSSVYRGHCSRPSPIWSTSWLARYSDASIKYGFNVATTEAKQPGNNYKTEVQLEYYVLAQVVDFSSEEP